MKITDHEQNILSILRVTKGRIPPSSLKRECRHSDCFVYVLTGEAEYFFDGKLHIAKPGTVIYLAHNSKYSINVTDENYTYIYTDFYFENEPNPAFENEIYATKGISMLKNAFENLHVLWNAGDYADKISCKSILYKVYAEVTKSCFSKYVSADRRKNMEEVVKYILDNLSDSELSITHLSTMCGVSEVHFRRLFSHIYRVSPIRFIVLARINRARELLLSEMCGISDVADMCGFGYQYYFSKVFKKETGMTPGEYRKFYRDNI